MEKNPKFIDKYTPALHFISSFQGKLIKNYKTQLQGILSLAVLQQLRQQIYFFRDIFQKDRCLK